MFSAYALIAFGLSGQVAAPAAIPPSITCVSRPPILTQEQAVCVARPYFQRLSCVYFGWSVEAEDRGIFWEVTLRDLPSASRPEGSAACPEVAVSVCKANGLIRQGKAEAEEC